MRTRYIYQIKLVGIAHPLTLISGREGFDMESIKGEIEWYRLISVIKDKGEDE